MSSTTQSPDAPGAVRPGPTLYVVPCSRAKRATAAPAGRLYIGSWYRLARAAADALAAREGGRVLILSALHGLLDVDEVVEPYDVTIAKLESRGGPGSLTLAHRVAAQLVLRRPERVVGLVPSSYQRVLASSAVIAGFDLGRGPQMVWPLAGCSGVGYQRQRLVSLRDGKSP